MSLEDFRNERLKKLDRLREAGIDPYPPSTARTHAVGEVLDRFEELKGSEMTIAGRIMARRGHGGLTFLDLDDGSGTLQALIGADRIGGEAYDFFSSVIDVGDIVEATGTLTTTKRGEKSVEAVSWRMLAKSLRPLPEKWHGLTDVEERYRARYLDLLFNPEVKANFRKRFAIVSAVRDFFRANGYLEVETPILQLIPGGATARPFETHLNTLDLDLFLRVAPELYLKRLLVGGFERVFELGRNFRNEGMDRDHNPELTMLEAYAAYRDHVWLMELTEELFAALADQFKGETLPRPFARMEWTELVKEASGLDYDASSTDEFAEKAKALGITIEKTWTKSTLADEIYKKTLRPKMTDPVFVINHPLELSPLSKKISPDADKVARFQLLVGGFELTNAFAELNDPVDQAGRFALQAERREGGDEEAHRVDDDYVAALEYGMPPAAGIGIGVDRLVAWLTGVHSLRDILLFPTMKPKSDA